MSQVFEAVEKHFPETLEIPALFDRVDEELRKAGLGERSVLVAPAVCQDDSLGQLQEAVQRSPHYQASFNNQDLAGFPVDITSIEAWYAHIPDDGVGVYIVGPHIGFDNEGRAGYIHREGIAEVGHSCGAQWGILGLFQSEQLPPYDNRPALSSIAQTLVPHKDEILDADEPLVEMTNRIHRLGTDRALEWIAATQVAKGKGHPVLVVSGVNVDTGHEEMNHFQLREVYLLQNGEQQNIFNYNA